MADLKISALTASSTPLAGTEVLPIVQSGSTVKVSVANLTAGRSFDALGMTLTSTDAGAAAAPLLELYRDSATPAASDTIGEIEFNGEDSAGNKQAYGLIHASILSPTTTAEQGQIHFETATAGALTEKMIIGTTNLVINEIGAVFNVRIEGDTDANLFVTDATNSRIGVGTLTPSEKLDIVGNAKLSGILTVGAATGQNSVFDAVVGNADATTGDNTGLVIVSNSTGRGWLGFNNGNSAGIPGQVTYNHSTNVMDFYSSGTYTLSNGNVTVSTGNVIIGTSGKGIDFSITSSGSGTMTSELLADYEEGTWSPTLEAESGTFGAITYNALNGGRYTKIGNVVHIQALLYTDSVAVGTASLEVRVAGLPFTSVASSGTTQNGFSSLAISQSSLWVTNQPSAALVRANSTQMGLFYRSTANGASNVMTVSEVTTGSSGNVLRLTGTYIAA